MAKIPQTVLDLLQEAEDAELLSYGRRHYPVPPAVLVRASKDLTRWVMYVEPRKSNRVYLEHIASGFTIRNLKYPVACILANVLHADDQTVPEALPKRHNALFKGQKRQQE
jgi:hypothetical protein